MADERMTRDDEAALEQMLEAYGADTSRWPARMRARLAPVLRSADARARLDEASALDRLLDLAPVVSVERERVLAKRIAQLAEPAPGSATSPAARTGAPAEVISIEARRAQRRAATLAPAAAVEARRPAGQRSWQAAAMLAASLVLGVILGQAGSIGAADEVVASVMGLEPGQEAVVSVLQEEFATLSDEDV